MSVLTVAVVMDLSWIALLHLLCPPVFQVERKLCSASAEFEDFVLQFMDRYFNQCLAAWTFLVLKG